MPRAGVTKIRKGSAILGQIIDATSETLDSGFLWCDGRTIGNASSGATARANADTQELFVHLWNNFANAQAAVSGGRGASALADFNANKTITLPDLRGRVVAGKDNMGGSAANRLTSGASGVAGNTIGATGGAETHTLSGLTANSLYFLYMRINSGSVILTSSTSVPSVYRASFPEAILVGAFYADGMSPVAFGSFVNIEGVPETSSVPYLPVLEATGTNPNLGSTGVREGFWVRKGSRIHLDLRFVASGTGITAGSGSYRTIVPFSFGSNNLGVTGQYVTAQVGRSFGTVPSTAVNLTAFRSGSYIYWYQSDGGIGNGEFSTSIPASAFTASGNSLTTKADYEAASLSNTPLKDL